MASRRRLIRQKTQSSESLPANIIIDPPVIQDEFRLMIREEVGAVIDAKSDIYKTINKTSDTNVRIAYVAMFILGLMVRSFVSSCKGASLARGLRPLPIP
jgi:hypothetical protein